MPVFRQGELELAYDEYGSGYPLVLFAPGGMHSRSEFWAERPAQWIDPRTALADRYRIIAIDQRNAGRSRGPVRATDGWHTYGADAVALLQHLGIRSVAVMGGCIGVSFALAFCARPEIEVVAAVLQNPVGDGPGFHEHFAPVFDEWAGRLRSTRGDVDEHTLAALRANMFGGEFVFSVDRDFIRSWDVPLLVLPGNDQFHPTWTAEEIAALAPRATLVRAWHPSEIGDAAAIALIRDFLDGAIPRASHQR